LEAVASPELRRVSASIIEAIEKARDGKGRRDPVEKLEKRIAHLENQLAGKDAKIAELEEVARTLGYIRVEVPTAEPVPISRPRYQPLITASAERSREVATAVCDCEDEPRAETTDGYSVSAPVIDLDADEIGAADETLPPAVLRHVDRIASRISRADLLHQRVLAFLVTHAPGPYSVEQIAAWTSCARELIDDQPPREFIDTGLLGRERRTDGTYYRSSLKSYVSQEFAVYQPDIGAHGLHLVMRLLRDRLGRAAIVRKPSLKRDIERSGH